MKLKNLSKIIGIFFMVPLILGTALQANGDIGGGSGRIITPYVPGKEIKEEEVVEVKKISSRLRRINNLRVENSHISKRGIEVGLMYVKDETADKEPFFKFKGVIEGDDTPVEIDFSEVDRFFLLKVKKPWFSKDKALLEVIQFPDVSPGDILAKKTSYTELRENYTKKVRLWVKLEEEGELCLVGKVYGQEDYKVLSKLRDIKQNSEVILEYGFFQKEPGGIQISSIWWAIDSVIKDKKYPYKVYTDD